MKFRIGSIVGWTCAGLVSALTVFSAMMEFIPLTDPAMIAYVERIGVGAIAYPLGITKLILVALFLFPRTSTVGFVLMVGYYGGALATHLTHPGTLVESAPIVVVLLLLTVSAYFRNPELLHRLKGRVSA